MRFLVNKIFALGLLPFLSLPLLADDTWTVDDIVNRETARHWTLSPDGYSAAWVKTYLDSADEKETFSNRLMLSDLRAASSRPLTHSAGRMSRPRFSPDGQSLVFLWDRAVPGAKKIGKRQLWELRLDGGAPRPLSRHRQSIQDFGWLDDNQLVFMAAEQPGEWTAQRKEKHDTTEVADDAEHEPYVRLWTLNREKGKATRLTENDHWMDALWVAPDGQRAVVTAQQSLTYEFDEQIAPKTYLVNLETGELQDILPERHRTPMTVRWQSDSSGFYFVHHHTTHPIYTSAAIQVLAHFRLQDGAYRAVDFDWPAGLGSSFFATEQGVFALLADGVRYREMEAKSGRQGWTYRTLEGEHVGNIQDWEGTLQGDRLVYRYSRANLPPQWYVANLKKGRLENPRKLTDLNPHLKDKRQGKVEVVRWKGAREEEVEGILYYPYDYQEGQAPAPLILIIHGGPSGVDLDAWSARWSEPKPLWLQRGAFILEVNYHGSSNYGLDWLESLRGHYYELEVPDIEKGVDTLIARGLVDEERLGTVGWSNGGILSAEMITRTHRYKAASIGAADVEWYSDWANVDFGAGFDNYYFLGPPWEQTKHYYEKSPFFRLAEVTTPTLIHTGTDDRNVPPHQSWSLFKALQQIGQAPTKLLTYPGEPHSLRQVVHQRRKIQEDIEWFDQYLFEKTPKAWRAVRSGSPLDLALKRSRAAKTSDGRFGEERDGRLWPEFVPFHGLDLSRFEITQAQFFSPEEAPRPNHPVTAISGEDAQAFAEKLSKQGDACYRLPTGPEMKLWTASVKSKGNTLEYWIGYKPSPEDLEALSGALGELGEAGSLLQSVGRFSPSKEGGVYDLNGNASEWTQGEDGTFLAVGSSADRLRAPTKKMATDNAHYRGFRLVKETCP